MQTTYTELSLDLNEALSLASVVRQSCSTARLRGDADPEPQAVARVRTPAFGLRLASMARSRGVLEVHSRENAHSEPRHSNLAAPMYQPQRTALLPFRARFPRFAARLRVRQYPFF